MRWEDERYVRVYTRDTVDWLGLSFIAQGLFMLILRKVDRAGLIKLGKQGKRGVAIVIGFAGEWARLEPALEELLADGCVRIQGEHLIVPNFIEAQEAVMSDKQRKAESRAKARDLAAAAEVLNSDNLSENVTDCHETGQKVTNGHAASHAVTPNCAVPCRAEPSLSPVVRLPTRDELRAYQYPKTAALLHGLTALGEIGAWPKEADTCALVEAGIGSQPLDAVTPRVAAAIKATGIPWLGHHLAAIRGASPPPKDAKRSRGMATPSTDWTSEEATKL